MKGKRPRTTCISLLAMFTLIALIIEVTSVNVYAYVIDGAIVYEQPTNITQLSKIPLQILIALGLAVAAITILMLYKARK